MPSLSLPPEPDLDHLKGQARSLQRSVRAGDPDAIGAVRRFHPRPDTVADPATFPLGAAQLVLARRYGFPSWPALRRHVAVVAEHSRSPHQVPLPPALSTDGDGGGGDGEVAAVARLLRLGCLVYGGDDVGRHSEATALLRARPELASAHISAAAAVGNVPYLREAVAGDPALANRPGGPFRWPPLLYLAYSRIDSDDPDHRPLDAAEVLLAAGADPDAGYLWEGTYPFTALTGALGGGEDRGNQPPHKESLGLARLLLVAGADPNDSQALYNRQFDPDDGHLRLLIEFGLGTDRGGPWHARLGSSQGTPAQLLEDQLSVAAAENRPTWARLALDAGAAPDGRGTAHPIRGGMAPYELALRRGNREVADLLLAAGATPTSLDAVDTFLAACMADDWGEVGRLLAARPGLAAEAVARRPHAILQAAELGRAGVVEGLARVGFDVNALARITALHQAAYDGDVAVVQTLLRLGADPDRKDLSFGSPALAWAEHARQDGVIEILRGVTRPRNPDGSW